MEKTSVLIAEDNPDLRAVLHLMLEHAGFDVMTAEDGATALWILGQHHPDVILADLMMPRVDGIELIRCIREREELAPIPIIAMSAYGGDHLAKAYVVGATVTLRKPLDADGLVGTINSVLQGGSTTSH